MPRRAAAAIARWRGEGEVVAEIQAYVVNVRA